MMKLLLIMPASHQNRLIPNNKRRALRRAKNQINASLEKTEIFTDALRNSEATRRATERQKSEVARPGTGWSIGLPE